VDTDTIYTAAVRQIARLEADNAELQGELQALHELYAASMRANTELRTDLRFAKGHIQDWRTRAIAAEAALAELRAGISELKF
jgi:chromosome segregation ATPase